MLWKTCSKPKQVVMMVRDMEAVDEKAVSKI